MGSCVKYVHDDGTRPDINCLAIRGLMQNLRGHVEQCSALGLDVGGGSGLNLGAESEVNNLNGSKISRISD